MTPLTDLSPMPFGKYGPDNEKRLMQDVPASYLHYLWDSCKFKNFSKDPPPSEDKNQHIKNSWLVAQYIKESLDALKMEDEDRIW